MYIIFLYFDQSISRYSSKFKLHFWTLDFVFMIFFRGFLFQIIEAQQIGPLTSSQFVCFLGNNWLNAFLSVTLKS